jgi:hypothetical protein
MSADGTDAANSRPSVSALPPPNLRHLFNPSLEAPSLSRAHSAGSADASNLHCRDFESDDVKSCPSFSSNILSAASPQARIRHSDTDVSNILYSAVNNEEESMHSCQLQLLDAAELVEVHVENNRTGREVPLQLWRASSQRSSHTSNAMQRPQQLDFNDTMPFYSWLGRCFCFESCKSSNRCINSGIQLLIVLSFLLLFICCFVIDVLIIVLYRFPTNFICCWREGRWFNYRLAIQDIIEHKKSLLAVYFTIVLSLVTTLSLILPNTTPNGHTGSDIVEGSCNNLTRCHASALCHTLSPSSYTCTCPSWLIGSGFDDDPCICQRSGLPVPDFSRRVCVTALSYFTVAGLIVFIVGMTSLCVLSILVWVHACGKNGAIGLLFLPLVLIVLAVVGQLNPYPNPVCGQSSFGAQVCEAGTICSDDGTCVNCAQGSTWVNGRCREGDKGASGAMIPPPPPPPGVY